MCVKKSLFNRCNFLPHTFWNVSISGQGDRAVFNMFLISLVFYLFTFCPFTFLPFANSNCCFSKCSPRRTNLAWNTFKFKFISLGYQNLYIPEIKGTSVCCDKNGLDYDKSMISSELKSNCLPKFNETLQYYNKTLWYLTYKHFNYYPNLDFRPNFSSTRKIWITVLCSGQLIPGDFFFFGINGRWIFFTFKTLKTCKAKCEIFC